MSPLTVIQNPAASGQAGGGIFVLDADVQILVAVQSLQLDLVRCCKDRRDYRHNVFLCSIPGRIVPETVDLSLKLVRDRGRIVVLGFHVEPAKLILGEDFWEKELVIKG